jgi:hypothetical protein
LHRRVSLVTVLSHASRDENRSSGRSPYHLNPLQSHRRVSSVTVASHASRDENHSSGRTPAVMRTILLGVHYIPCALHLNPLCS